MFCWLYFIPAFL